MSDDTAELTESIILDCHPISVIKYIFMHLRTCIITFRSSQGNGKIIIHMVALNFLIINMYVSIGLHVHHRWQVIVTPTTGSFAQCSFSGCC